MQLSTTTLATDANLKGYWRFEGNSNDSSGAGHNGADTAISYSSTIPKYLQNASFNGSTSLISIPTSSDFAPAVYSLAFWCYITTGGVSNWVFGKDTFGSRQFVMGLDAANKLYAEHAGGVCTAESGNAISINRWHHCVIVFSGGTWSALYIDGVPQTLNISGTPTVLSNVATPLTIGKRTFVTDPGFFNGLLDDVAWFTRALTSTEVLLLYQQGFSGAII